MLRTPCRIGALALVAALANVSSAAAPIRDNADLDSYLAHVAPGESPLDRLSPPARKRFLATFRTGTFSWSDLEAELTRDEAAAILKLFALESLLPSMRFRTSHLPIGASETAEASARFDALSAALSGSAGRDAAAAYRGWFAQRQSEATLRRLSDGDVALVLRAALAVAAIEPSLETRDVLADLAELERRGIVAPAWIGGVYRAFIERRDFAAAAALRERHPDANLPEPPLLRDEAHGDGPTVLDATDDGRTLVRRTLVLEPSQVIVVAGCHFSKDAVRDIEADPALRTAFSRHVIWITPADGDPADPALAQWNHEHPLAAMRTVYRANEWPSIDSWAMPTFYFLRNGRVESKVSGWQGQRDAVMDGFHRIGLGP